MTISNGVVTNDILNRITGTELNDRLVGGAEGDLIHGLGGNDILIGGGGNDQLIGGDGNDQLVGGTGADILDGGDGTDMASYQASMAGVTVNLLTDTASGGDAEGDVLFSIENLTGSAAWSDNLTGDRGNNVLYGLGGDDRLDGGAGNDTLFGGIGADTLIGGAGIDLADYSLSAEGVTVDLNAGTGTGGEAEGDTLTGIENLNGSTHADTLTGDSANNGLNGGNGDDWLKGGWGHDRLDGGAGDDVLYGDHEIAGDDPMGGNDVLIGGRGSDVLVGGYGADILIGGTSQYNDDPNDSDTVSYEDATVHAGIRIDLLAGTASGVDSLAEGDRLYGIENIIGSHADDTIIGDTKANILDGSWGNDVLNGQEGNDTMIGGYGSDIYRHNRGDGFDTVVQDLTGDALQTTDTLVFGDGITRDDLSFQRAGNDLVISVRGNGVFEASQVVVKNQFVYDGRFAVDRIEATGDGSVMAAADVRALVDAMAGFAPAAIGQTALDPAATESLQPVLAAWA